MQSGLTTVLNSASTSAPPRVIDVTNMAANEVQALRYTFFKVRLPPPRCQYQWWSWWRARERASLHRVVPVMASLWCTR